ncbi:MAG: S1C family serine protease [Alphaproteobacteria bacterium]
MNRFNLLGMILSVVCLMAAPATAQQNAAEHFKAIVKVTSTVPGEARTAATLGTTREGTGVVLDSEGLIVTVGYVILEASSVEIETADGKTIPAETLAYDHDTGFGLLRSATAPGVKPLELGSSKDLAQKQPVLVAAHGGAVNAIGAFVVDRRDFAGYWEYLLDDAIFTSPPFAQFGGAALIDAGGKLVGIGSLIVPNALERDGGALPGNMFIPVDALKPILGDLIAKGRSSKKNRPWLGLYSEMFRGRLFVSRVPESGPAWAAGIRPGDMVLGVARKPVTDLADFYRKVWALGDPGVDVPLLVLRGSKPAEMTVTSTDRYKWLRLKPTY